MIVFDLECRAGGHRFEGWFASREGFEEQQDRGLLACPVCGSLDIDKALSAPNLGRKGNQVATIPAEQSAPQVVAGGKLPPQAQAMMETLVRMQAAVLEQSRWVGGSFAEDARAMHYGEREAEPIYGEASAEEAHELVEEGVSIAPLLFPIAPPDEIN